MQSIEILNILTTQTPFRTADLPKDKRGIYGLIDHEGKLCYIGSTSGTNESFHKRIHQRHRTGSETYSHYFSKVYNCGRMWRDRISQQGHKDAKEAKDLRSAFIADYCGAVLFPINDERAKIEALEAEVIALASSVSTLWNGSTSLVYPEPTKLVDELITRLKFSQEQINSVKRQDLRCRGLLAL